MATGLDSDGSAICKDCRTKHRVNGLETCVLCDHFVCKSCATYRRQGSPYGYVCKACYRRLSK